jgi:hypothetical protein
VEDESEVGMEGWFVSRDTWNYADYDPLPSNTNYKAFFQNYAWASRPKESVAVLSIPVLPVKSRVKYMHKQIALKSAAMHASFAINSNSSPAKATYLFSAAS